MIYAFGAYTLDTERHELRRAGSSCPIEPRVYDVLLYLIHHRDRVVSKQELLDSCMARDVCQRGSIVSASRRRASGGGRQ